MSHRDLPHNSPPTSPPTDSNTTLVLATTTPPHLCPETPSSSQASAPIVTPESLQEDHPTSTSPPVTPDSLSGLQDHSTITITTTTPVVVPSYKRSLILSGTMGSAVSTCRSTLIESTTEQDSISMPPAVPDLFVTPPSPNLADTSDDRSPISADHLAPPELVPCQGDEDPQEEILDQRHQKDHLDDATSPASPPSASSSSSTEEEEPVEDRTDRSPPRSVTQHSRKRPRSSEDEIEEAQDTSPARRDSSLDLFIEGILNKSPNGDKSHRPASSGPASSSLSRLKRHASSHSSQHGTGSLSRPSKPAKRQHPDSVRRAMKGRRTAGNPACPSSEGSSSRSWSLASSTRLQKVTTGLKDLHMSTGSSKASIAAGHANKTKTSSPKSPGKMPFSSVLEEGKLRTRPGQRKIWSANGNTIKAGHTIAALSPSHPILHTRLIETHCSGCLLDPKTKAELDHTDPQYVANRFLKCGRCARVWWCSLKCYARHGHAHFDECRALSVVRRVPSAEVRLLARACIMKAEGKARPEVLLMPISHHEMSQLGPILRDLTTFLGSVHKDTRGYQHLDYTEYGCATAVEFFDFVRTVRQHIVPMTDAFAAPLGVCLAPTISTFGHSCRPNAQLCWPYGPHGSKPLRVIAIDEIEPEKEILLAHVDLAIPIHRRTGYLSAKGFNHNNCHWCLQERREKVDIRWAAKHHYCDGLVRLTGEFIVM
ncbi:hypothetical protein BD324DRAFT_64346 [Kockovaella imperatae]|uniref:SET domain-containing protein n=1 Tax=Kockovaella imperatae TaxID=4999 RepID=A0A1Y1UDJ9_9TREE|nr:hypothetical protein BD324DRAFT_64346 [Kockovaella imperatae]ORX35627.1 hypothetical protein BD324DRAFT_64346 [Kockovaella imperatae]